jgi:hypothetical protein
LRDTAENDRSFGILRHEGLQSDSLFIFLPANGHIGFLAIIIETGRSRESIDLLPHQ